MKLGFSKICEICGVLTELNIISKDKMGVFIINAKVVDLRNVKMKSESTIMRGNKNNTLM